MLALSGFLLTSGHLRSPEHWQQTFRGSFQTRPLLVHSLLKQPCGLAFGVHHPFLTDIGSVSLCRGSHQTTKPSLLILWRDARRPCQSLESVRDPRTTTICVLRTFHPAALSAFFRVIVKVPVWPWPLKMSTCQERFLCCSLYCVSLAMFSTLLTSVLSGSVEYAFVKMFCVVS